jgi:formylglycine-generating enzyme required for sulfatase activity
MQMNSMRIALVFLVSSFGATASASDELKVGQAFRECAECPQLIVVPSGTFLMGAPADEPRAPWFAPKGVRPAVDPEGPVHRVKIATFAIGKYPVTRAQWIAFVTATDRPIQGGCEWSGFSNNDEATLASASWRNLGFEQDDTHPVVCVSWNDAQAYVRWLKQRTGHTYRLPTEAEWEYAARAGSTTAYPWGEPATHEHANYGSDECCSELAAGADRWLHTSPVGSFPANAFGLFDMHGNAWQWVQDCYEDSYAGAPIDGSARDAPDCKRRALRGGTWGDPPGLIRSATRNWAPPPPSRWNPDWEYRSGGVGFRVVREL